MNFIKTFFISSLLFICFFVAIIVSVDPYDKLGNNLFNFQTKAVAQSRENKFRLLETSTKPYEAFILGSSAAHRYPTSKLEELTGLKTFNYAVQHSTPIDYLAITKHILSRYKPKLIFLQLDFSAMDENYKVDNRLYNSPLKNFLSGKINQADPLFENDYFTLEALSDSLRVFHVNYFGKARHIYAEDGNYIYEKIVPHKINIKQSSNPNYIFSNSRLDILKQISKLASDNKFKLVIISAPISINHLNTILNDKNFAEIHRNFVSKLENNFEHFINFQTTDIKEYDSYEYFHDSVHPTKILSEIILEKVFK